MPIGNNNSLSFTTNGQTGTSWQYITTAQHFSTHDFVGSFGVSANAPMPEPIVQNEEIDMTDEVGSIDNVNTTDDNPMGMSPEEVNRNLRSLTSLINRETDYSSIRFNPYHDYAFSVYDDSEDSEDSNEDEF